MPLFCRHNRFTADCPICSKDMPGVAAAGSGSGRQKSRGRSAASSSRAATSAASPARVRGPYASAGPYEDGDSSYEVRLERVPGGLRLAEWSGEELRRRAPVLAAADLDRLVSDAAAQGLLGEAELAKIVGGSGNGVSKGRAGELREELRAEQLDDGRLRVGRWLYRPGTREWELQEAPPMLPPGRYAEALAGMSAPRAL